MDSNHRPPPCQGGIVIRANLLGAAFYTVFSYCQKWQIRHNENNGLQYGFGLVHSSPAIGLLITFSLSLESNFPKSTDCYLEFIKRKAR